MQETEFDINRDAVKNYYLVIQVLSWFGFAVLLSPVVFSCMLLPMIALLGGLALPLSMFITLVIYGTGLAGGIVYCQWLCPQQTNNLHYRLDSSTLRADGGVFFLARKSIPLERITDVALVQGPLMRFFNIWAMRIQTAGSAQCEATLYGVREPEKVRELILSQRKSVCGEKTEDA
jgi:membrane protein YdbS with pleckstrin-like domain